MSEVSLYLASHCYSHVLYYCTETEQLNTLYQTDYRAIARNRSLMGRGGGPPTRCKHCFFCRISLHADHTLTVPLSVQQSRRQFGSNPPASLTAAAAAASAVRTNRADIPKKDALFSRVSAALSPYRPLPLPAKTAAATDTSNNSLHGSVENIRTLIEQWVNNNVL